MSSAQGAFWFRISLIIVSLVMIHHETVIAASRGVGGKRERMTDTINRLRGLEKVGDVDEEVFPPPAQRRRHSARPVGHEAPAESAVASDAGSSHAPAPLEGVSILGSSSEVRPPDYIMRLAYRLDSLAPGSILPCDAAGSPINLTGREVWFFKAGAWHAKKVVAMRCNELFGDPQPPFPSAWEWFTPEMTPREHFFFQRGEAFLRHLNNFAYDSTIALQRITAEFAFAEGRSQMMQTVLQGPAPMAVSSSGAGSARLSPAGHGVTVSHSALGAVADSSSSSAAVMPSGVNLMLKGGSSAFAGPMPEMAATVAGDFSRPGSEPRVSTGGAAGGSAVAPRRGKGAAYKEHYDALGSSARSPSAAEEGSEESFADDEQSYDEEESDAARSEHLGSEG